MKKSAVVALLLLLPTASPTYGQGGVSKFDVVGVRLGDDAVSVFKKFKLTPSVNSTGVGRALCSIQLIDHAASGRRDELNARQGECIGLLELELDDVSRLRVEFVEDVRKTPSNSVVTKIEIRYRYGERGPKPMPASEVREMLVKKYGAPVSEGNFLMEWGYPMCMKRQCPPDEAHLRARIGEYVVMADPRLATDLKAAIRALAERARPTITLRF